MPVIIPSHGLARIDYNGLWRHPRRFGTLPHVLLLEREFYLFSGELANEHRRRDADLPSKRNPSLHVQYA